MDHSPQSWVFQRLSFKDTVVVICASAVAVHGIFKRYEPPGIFTHIFLLFLPPAILATILRGHVGVLSALLVSYLTYWSTLAFSIIAYRLSPFHPLACYPGPVLMKVSKLWAVKIDINGYQHLHIQRLHNKYGDIVRIGPNELSIRDVSAIEHLYGTNGLPKGPIWVGRTLASPVIHLLAEPEPKLHALRRRPWNRALGKVAMKDHEEIIAKRVLQLAEHLDALASSEIELTRWFSALSYDIMSDMAFGGGLEMMRDGDVTGLASIVEHGMLSSFVLGHIPWFGKYAGKLFTNGSGRMRALGSSFAMNRIKRGSLTRDIFYYLNNEDGAQDSQPPLTQVVPDGTLAIVAGSDTTSSALTCLFAQLMRCPEAYKCLQAEIDRFYPPGEDACNSKHHSKMPYLTAVLNENLRLYPAAPAGSQRTTTTVPGGKHVGPVYLPEGTHVSVHTYTLQRDPRYFSPDPESFWPERWLLAAGDTTVKLPPGAQVAHNLDAFVPFSYGPMNCPGRAVAFLEMRIAVCVLMQRFVMRLPAHADAGAFDRALQDMFVWRVPELPAVIERRAGVQA